MHEFFMFIMDFVVYSCVLCHTQILTRKCQEQWLEIHGTVC